MVRALTPGLTVSPRTVVRKVRELPIAGTVEVKVGDRVVASDVVARAELLGEMYIVRLPERIGLEANEVCTSLRVSVGERVAEGQILLEHSGLFGLVSTKFPSPVAGTVELITEATGHIGIRLAPYPVDVRAYIAGRVIKVEDTRGATIESEAAFVQGIFGIGGEQHGILTALEVKPSERVEASDLAESLQRAILFGGAGVSLEALRTAAERGAKGIITGSIDDEVLKGYLGYDLGVAVTGDEAIPLTVIITEGFGSIAISDRVLGILSALEGEEAAINGATQVRAGAVRPEVIVPRPSHGAGDAQKLESSGLATGANVRIIRYPYFGVHATVVGLPPELRAIGTGAHARVLIAKLESGEEVVIPRANVELL